MASTSALTFLIFGGCAGVLVLVCFAASRLLRPPATRDPALTQSPSTGRSPENAGRRQLAIPYRRLIAVAVVWQAVIVLLFTWAVPMRRLLQEGGQMALAGLGVFIAVIITGYVYVWSQGGFDWDPAEGELRDGERS